MAGMKARGGKKNRKYGHNKKRCEVYENLRTREKNKAIKLLRYIRRIEKKMRRCKIKMDMQAMRVYEALPEIFRDSAEKVLNKKIALSKAGH